MVLVPAFHAVVEVTQLLPYVLDIGIFVSFLAFNGLPESTHPLVVMLVFLNLLNVFPGHVALEDSLNPHNHGQLLRRKAMLALTSVTGVIIQNLVFFFHILVSAASSVSHI